MLASTVDVNDTLETPMMSPFRMIHEASGQHRSLTNQLQAYWRMVIKAGQRSAENRGTHGVTHSSLQFLVSRGCSLRGRLALSTVSNGDWRRLTADVSLARTKSKKCLIHGLSSDSRPL